jgi:hypothetical protein
MYVLYREIYFNCRNGKEDQDGQPSVAVTADIQVQVASQHLEVNGLVRTWSSSAYVANG